MLQEDIESINKIVFETQPDAGKEDELILKIINRIAPFPIRDKAGIFIGSRMGRPEKAKMRKLAGQPNMIFPIGEEGGKMRSLQSAMDAGKITSSFPIFYCSKCKRKTPFSVCEICDKPTEKKTYCRECKNTECVTDSHPKFPFANYELNINEIFPFMLKKLGTKIY